MKATRSKLNTRDKSLRALRNAMDLKNFFKKNGKGQVAMKQRRRSKNLFKLSDYRYAYKWNN